MIEEAASRRSAPAVRDLLADPGSPLGRQEDWPVELRSAVDLVLGSPQPMVVCWGPELRFLYNDAVVPGLGDHHPEVLGRPCREAWSEVWDEMGPALRQVRDTGRPVVREDDRFVVRRDGRPEETFWRHALSPIRGAGGGEVLGVLGVVAETTAQVLDARRARLLARLGEVSRDARTTAEALTGIAAILADAPSDAAFALFTIDDGAGPRLAASTGLEDPARAAAALRPPAPTPGGPAVAELVEPYGWVVRTVLPAAVAAPSIGLVLGVPPLRPLDDGHLSFLRRVLGHVETAVATAGTRSEEHDRLVAMIARDRSQTEFFTGVSHEFRTPLSLILGPLEHLRNSADAGVRRDAERAHRNAERMLKLVNSLLDVSRLEAGHHDAAFAPVDLGTLTGELAGMFREAIDRAGLSLDVDCPPAERPVWVDRDMWEKIVLNLLSNAVKFTFTGGISVSVRLEGEQAVLRLADTGTGVPAAELPRLFERFHRIRGARARSEEGSGIGLALVRRLVEVHSGTVEVTSTPDVGTTVTVRLPLGFAHLSTASIGTARTPVTTRPSPAAVEPFLAEALRWLPDGTEDAAGPVLAATVEAAGGSRSRVLVADDDPDMRDYLQQLLSANWVVQAVANGREALEAARADPPDLVVADVLMPGLDGIELLRALRTDARTAGLPVVLLSARAGEEAAVEGLDAGADDYLVKPFSARELLARVANHLQLGRVRRAAELRFRAMADSTPALIWVDDTGGHRTFVNRGWLDFTGVTDSVGELGLDWRARIHPEDRDRYRTVVEAAARAGVPFEVEYRLRDAGGRHRWVLDRGTPVGGDRAAGYIGGCLDIDDQHVERRRHGVYARLGDVLERELTRVDRLRALARTLVDEGLADTVRVYEGGAGTPVSLVAVGATDPAVERALWRLSGPPALTEHGGGAEPVRLGRAEMDATIAALPPTEAATWRGLGTHSGLVVPLRARGALLGVIGAVRTGASPPFDDADVDMIAEIARRAGVAVDNARLLELERASAQRLGLLHRATAEMSAAATPAEVARIATNHMVTLLGAPMAATFELRDEVMAPLAVHGWRGTAPASLPLTAPLPSRDAVERRTAIWLRDADECRARYPASAGYLAEDGPEAACWLPLVVGERTLGLIGVAFHEPRDFPESDREAALAVAELAAQALDRSFLLTAETDGRRLAERLGAIATALSRATDLDAVAEVIVAHGMSAVEAEAVVVMTADDEGVLHPLAADGWGGHTGDTRGSQLLADADHPLARVVRSGQPVWLAQRPPEPFPAHTAVPLLVGGRAIGAVGLRFAEAPTFTPERRGFVLTLASQCAQAVVRARLHQAEHEVAVTLQRSLLPQRLPELERLAVATRYKPGTEGTEAGGDWFDVLDLDHDRVALVVGDVVGRGPSAAAVMGQLRSALAANLVNGQSPASALEQLDLFARRVEGARASTVACAVVDCASGELVYACAGHPPPLAAGRDGGVRLLDEGRGTPLGVSGRPPFVESTTRIEVGETILLCSDGLFERRDEVIDDGLDRLVATFGPLAHAQPRDVVDTLLDRMLAGSGAPDDTAVVIARLLPLPLRELLPADAERLAPLRRRVTAWSTDCGLAPDALTDLQLAVGEAVTNAIEHAYADGVAEPAGEAVDVRLRVLQDGSVDVRVADRGTWRPPPEDPGYRGRGLALIRELAHDVAVEPGEDGTVVRFRVPPAPVEQPAALPGDAFEAHGTVPPGDGPARLRRWADEHTVRLHVDGDLDLAGVAAVRSDLLVELDGGRPLTLTLGTDSFVSSAGIALLVEVAQRARAAGGGLTVVTPSDSPSRRILVLAGLDTVIDLATDLRDGRS
ncbi:MAG: SpoIIE family protein phosphatase [Pseudonocardia sp.]|nr:SpoIIE family protein phosphatase [Pseudonocardia sp.]